MNFEGKTLAKIQRNKKKLEKKLNVKIEIKKNEVEILGNEANIYTTERVFSALERNFSFDSALLLSDEEYVLEDINIKEITKKKNLRLVKARIIGKRGTTLKLLSELSDCEIVLHENVVSIIGSFDKIKIAINAIKSLIVGKKQGNVFAYLEKARKRKHKNNFEIN